MRLSALLTALFACTAATAAAPPRRCGTEEVDAETLVQMERLHELEKVKAVDARAIAARDTMPKISVPVYFHTVERPDERPEDKITDAQLDDQFRVMADVFSQYDVDLQYNGVASRTVDDYLSKFLYPIDRQQREQFNSWRRATRVGGYGHLNVYFYTAMTDGYWGSATLPRAWNASTQQGVDIFYEDALNIHAGTIPGGRVQGVNMGYTAVHEAGHWLGLLHVFMGFNCGTNSDMIDDTPEQSTATEGCPIGKDSCPGFPGLDSIHNFMDYSEDACYSEFTPGQKLRMHSSFAEWRANPPAAPGGQAPKNFRV